MKMKQIAMVVGATAGLSLAAPAWVVAAGAQDGETGYQSGAMEQEGVTGESADTAAMEHDAAASQDLMQMKISDLEGKTLKNQNGDDLGEIDSVVRSKQDQSLHAVISAGGFLGVGAKKVTVPVERISMQNGDLIAGISSSPDEFHQQAAYDESGYDAVDSNQLLAEASGLAPEQAEIASFEQLDADQSGSISRDEAQANPDLSDNWGQYDLNADDQLDQTEFSAFEAMQMAPEQPAQPGIESQPGMEGGPDTMEPMQSPQSETGSGMGTQ